MQLGRALEMVRDGARALDAVRESAPLLRDATASGNLSVFAHFLGPALRGLIQRRGKSATKIEMATSCPAVFDWQYVRDQKHMARLYEAAKLAQWNATRDLDWSIDVDPLRADKPLMPWSFLPITETPNWARLTQREKGEQNAALLAWFLSQILHGEQGAFFAAAQVAQAVPSMDAKLYGGSQVADEARHVEVFHKYLSTKLNKVYEINDNLYVVVDMLMSDGRWDMKFLGMQIMVEGLALGAFETVRRLTHEPLLHRLLGYVITDEARHVHYGVLALESHIKQLSDKERREREDWTFEMSLLLRNRFLAHEFYEEYYAHLMTRAQWNEMVEKSQIMEWFRQSMFKRIIPNLKRIGLLSERLRPRYAELGLLKYEQEKAAPELSTEELLDSR